jgi:hypothetical protein
MIHARQIPAKIEVNVLWLRIRIEIMMVKVCQNISAIAIQPIQVVIASLIWTNVNLHHAKIRVNV